MKNSAVLISAIVFGIVGLIHFARLFCPYTVVIGTAAIPVWVSGIVFIVAGMLSGFLFRATHE